MPIRSVDISADGKDIVLGTENMMWGRIFVLNNTKPLGSYDKTLEYQWDYATAGNVNSVSMTADGNYITAGTSYSPTTGQFSENTVFLFNNSGYTYKEMRSTGEWGFNTSDHVNSVSISGWGNHFASGGPDGNGETFLFYHARPIPSALLPYVGGDDDDDDDEPAIPYGNYYLLFAVIGIVSLILIHKRKIIISKK